MKFTVLLLAICGVFALASARVHENPDLPHPQSELARPKREANPQGSVVIQGQKPLGGPDRRPSLDVNYNHRVYDRNGATADAYGGLNIRPGQSAQPHLGIQVGREFRNGHIGGFGQVQRGPGVRPDPTFGIGGRFRFRRDVDDADFEDNEQEY